MVYKPQGNTYTDILLELLRIKRDLWQQQVSVDLTNSRREGHEDKEDR